MVFEYISLIIILFVILFYYIRNAQKYQLMDLANERSSHVLATPRGGGFIIPISVLLYAIYFMTINGFFIGLLLVGLVSFWDDLKSLSDRWRLLIHLTAVILLVGETIEFSGSIMTLIISIIMILGTINAVNFMDGINGISVAFGIVTIFVLIYLNGLIDFVAQDLLYFTLTGVLVFAFFNFRRNAKCFAGDVGSVSLGYILVYFSLLFYLKTGDISVLVLWTVYGLDSVLTIMHRLLKRENIFIAHRSHLYQFYVNELSMKHLSIATIYGIIQAIINVLFVINFTHSFFTPTVFLAIILTIAGMIYTLIRLYVIQKIANINLLNEEIH
jgi:UDP-GlcNAc:undecaprenyl-phosphate/decaprenyl-phosphate GlcNAc-1-phosphate transferase